MFSSAATPTLTAALGLALVLSTGCARARTAEGAEAAATLEGAKAALLDAFTRKDPVELAALFAEDAAVIEPSGAILEGRAAIQARIAALLPAVRGYSLSSRRTEQSGDLLYDQQTFQLTLGAEGEEPRTLTGHQLVILARQADGGWKVARSGAWMTTPAAMPEMPGMPGMRH